jgi:hypothetical protein
VVESVDICLGCDTTADSSAATKASAADDDAVPASGSSIVIPSTFVNAGLFAKAVLEVDALSVERASAAIVPSATTDAKRMSSGSANAEAFALGMSLESASGAAETAGTRSEGTADVDVDGNAADAAVAIAIGLDLAAAIVARKVEAVETEFLDFAIRRKLRLCR